MKILSTAQIKREIDQLKQIVMVYYRHNLSDMVYDLEKRIFYLENLLESQT
jgi:hypothetical protein